MGEGRIGGKLDWGHFKPHWPPIRLWRTGQSMEDYEPTAEAFVRHALGEHPVPDSLPLMPSGRSIGTERAFSGFAAIALPNRQAALFLLGNHGARVIADGPDAVRSLLVALS